MRFALALIFAGTVSALVAAEQEALREWTDVDGKKINARLLGTESGRVALEVGRTRSEVPLVRLGAADRSYVEAWAKGKTRFAQLPPVHWPGKVSQEMPRIDGPEEVDGQYVFHTTHYAFASNEKLAKSVVMEFAQAAEATWKFLHAHPLHPPERKAGDRLQVRMASDLEAYARAGGPENTDGIFLNGLAGRGVMLVHFAALGIENKNGVYVKGRQFSPRVLVHEMGHQMMADYIPYQPLWLREGVAESATLATYANGTFTLDRTTILNQLKLRIADYTRRDPDQGGAEVKEEVDLGKWLVPLEELFAVTGDLREATLTERHRIYFSSLLMAFYYLYLEGDGEARRLRVYYEELEECARAYRSGGGEGKTQPGPPRRGDRRSAGLILTKSLLGEISPAKLQLDVEKKYLSVGIKVVFPKIAP